MRSIRDPLPAGLGRRHCDDRRRAVAEVSSLSGHQLIGLQAVLLLVPLLILAWRSRRAGRWNPFAYGLALVLTQIAGKFVFDSVAVSVVSAAMLSGLLFIRSSPVADNPQK
jgi:hypothetical protein